MAIKRRLQPGYLLLRRVVIPWLGLWFRWHLEGLEHLPKSGPAIVASNHLSYLDGFAVGYAVVRGRRWPCFLTKSSLFQIPLVGWIVRTAGHIPVARGTRAAPESLQYAEAALSEGEVVVLFPEGTTTTAPDLSPRMPRTGVSRLALTAGLEVIPCATWGGQWFWTKHLGVHPGPGKPVWVRFGPPISLSSYAKRSDDPAVWRDAAAAVQQEIQELLVDLKAAKPWTPQTPTRKKFLRAQKRPSPKKPVARR